MDRSQQAFVNMLWPAALQASQKTGIDPRIIVAQAAQETGWGKSAPGNNYFGIKSHGQGGGQTFTTHEVINGQRVKMQDSFRKFGSPEESVMGYADFMLQNPRYRPMREAQGLDSQLQALGKSGYATDPNYASSVGKIARMLPEPTAPLSSSAQQFVDGNPQPGGFGPGIQPTGSTPAAPASQPMTMAQSPEARPSLRPELAKPAVSEPPSGLMALLKDEEVMNPLLSLLSEQDQGPQLMQPPPPATQVPSLGEYLQSFMKTRLS